MMSKKLISLFMLAIFVLTLSACGQNRNNENPETGETYTNQHEHAGIGIPSNAEVFTVSVSATRQQFFEQVRDSFMEEMALLGRDVYVEFLTFMHHEIDEHTELMLSKYAAGVGPDIFVNDFIRMDRFIKNNFLMDINMIITEPENLFTNVLEGMELDSRLYSMPLNFLLQFVGINANVPPEFTERFAALNGVSPSDLFSIKNDLIADHPEFSEMAFVNGAQNMQLFMPEINNLISLRDRTANFSEETTLRFLEDIRLAFADNNRFDTGHVFEHDADSMAILRERYLFFMPRGSVAEIEATFDFQEQFFVHYQPLADESGRLVSQMMGWDSISVGATADGELAWAFIQHAINASVTADRLFNVVMPIDRRYFRANLESSISSTLNFSDVRPFVGREYAAIDRAINQLEAFSQMPMINPLNNLLPIWEFTFPLFNFFEGEITALEAAREMEENFIVWANEEHEIEPFVYIPAPPAEYVDLGLPAMTISVLTDERNTAVIEQAAAKLNASWRQHDVPYVFRVEIEEMRMTDGWEAQQARMERLGVEIMSGQGPDILMLNESDINRFIFTDFLQDINTLISECPVLERGDFFEEALNANEVFGRLRNMPLSFGFMYIGVNTGLPQPFIDRFTRAETFSLIDIMEFKTDFANAHGDEFPQFTEFNLGTFDLSLHSIYQNTFNNFIDINTRTSNLTDPAFVAFLEAYTEFNRNWERPSSMTMAMPLNGPDILRQRTRDQIFNTETQMLSPINAYFSPVSPYFYPFLPISDYNGRLVLSSDSHGSGPVWATVSITTRANGALAWELVRYLIHAYTNPEGSARFNNWGGHNAWGEYSLATPILRSLFYDHAKSAFENALSQAFITPFIGVDDPTEKARQIDAAITRMATLIEMPMSRLTPMLPRDLPDHEALWQFHQGLITAEAAAQMMHNAIGLWMMEQR